MISFNYESDFTLENESQFEVWIQQIIRSEQKSEGDINYIFCDDAYLLEINQKYLDHDYYTDIISFDYSVTNELHGDIFISIERVAENAQTFEVSFQHELLRVMAHGILHYCGYKDKSDTDAQLMRQKEDEKISMFHVEHRNT
ncbi:MAG: rRNA maturation RNase YbeY [Flavobacterium sp.]|jgi:probable rRNA maturation factor|uniref:rRNA maturation RNase YbeY n=1 Tax=Flavobacterium sp. TaxID=239 RepID=UPI0022C5DD0A|nr:rRNA maturation RNase YbeY [Flavobacterium sp.]MCZ8168394.1 rRNA maturation RNase YbeY [Flavobacterium sp.]MCZ8296648.1 rRNA maturation RNase YbeY [Flavobacterium sp.]